MKRMAQRRGRITGVMMMDPQRSALSDESEGGSVMDSDNETETEENENQHVTHLRDPETCKFAPTRNLS